MDDQRRRDLEYQIRELQKRSAEIRLAHRGDYSPEVSSQLAELESEVERLRGLLYAIAPGWTPAQQPIITNQQLLEMWKGFTELRLDIREWRKEDRDAWRDEHKARAARNLLIDRWIIAIICLLAVVYGLVIALGVSVWSVR